MSSSTKRARINDDIDNKQQESEKNTNKKVKTTSAIITGPQLLRIVIDAKENLSQKFRFDMDQDSYETIAQLMDDLVSDGSIESYSYESDDDAVPMNDFNVFLVNRFFGLDICY